MKSTTKKKENCSNQLQKPQQPSSDFDFAMVTKLMRLGSPNRIDVVELNLKSKFDRRIIVDSDSNDLIESSITISI